MFDSRRYIELSIGKVDLRESLIEFGEAVDPIICGEPEGYVQRAKEFLKKHLCAHTCKTLACNRTMAACDIAAAVGDGLVSSLGGNPSFTVVLLWKVATALASAGLPQILQCSAC